MKRFQLAILFLVISLGSFAELAWAGNNATDTSSASSEPSSDSTSTLPSNVISNVRVDTGT